MSARSMFRWLLGLLLAWGTACAQAELAWQRSLHPSYAEAIESVARAQAAAVTPAERDEAARRALEVQALYGRHAELAALLRELSERPGLADERLLYQARLDMLAGRHAEGARLLEPLRRKFVRLPEGPLRRELRLTLATLDLHLGQPEDATRELNRIVDAAREAGDLELAARAFSALGAVQLEMFDYAAGLAYYQQALRLAPSWALQTRERARMGMAQMHHMLGNRREALALLDTALAAFHRSQNLRAEADALLLRGFFLSRDGQVQAALEPYRQALALREQLGGDADVVNALTHLCGTLSDARLLSEALSLCERATRMAEATDSQSLRWDAYWVSAEVQAAAGDFRLAYEHQQRATRALQKHARLNLVNMTGAMRERFDTDRQRQEVERLSAQLEDAQAMRAQWQRIAAVLGLLAVALAGVVAWRWPRRGLAAEPGAQAGVHAGAQASTQASLNSASAL